MSEGLRELPSVEELASVLTGVPHTVAVAAARGEIAAARQRLLSGDEPKVDRDELERAARDRAAELDQPKLRRVINATGVVLHTNLGRAPLPAAAVEAVRRIAAGYSNLELDLATGERGSRHSHVGPLVCEITGAEAAIAVNNNAAAVLLALAAVAAGGEVVVSRGELVEIGGSFRIPDILVQSGATLIEVGTTNRTRLGDYAAAVGPDTAAILHVHQSNFRTVGFTEAPTLPELAGLASERGVLLIADLGSGALGPVGDEPTVRAAVGAGTDLVCFSGDKLLGAAQAGLLAGRRDAVERCRRHPLARAVRLDKLQLAALEATLRVHRDVGAEGIPALAMLARGEDELEARARRMAAEIGGSATVERATARPGGGALPLTELEGPVCAVTTQSANRLCEVLRRADPPVIARIEGGLVILDPRTMDDEEADVAARAVARALG